MPDQNAYIVMAKNMSKSIQANKDIYYLAVYSKRKDYDQRLRWIISLESLTEKLEEQFDGIFKEVFTSKFEEPGVVSKVRTKFFGNLHEQLVLYPYAQGIILIVSPRKLILQAVHNLTYINKIKKNTKVKFQEEIVEQSRIGEKLVMIKFLINTSHFTMIQFKEGTQLLKYVLENNKKKEYFPTEITTHPIPTLKNRRLFNLYRDFIILAEDTTEEIQRKKKYAKKVIAEKSNIEFLEYFPADFHNIPIADLELTSFTENNYDNGILEFRKIHFDKIITKHKSLKDKTISQIRFSEGKTTSYMFLVNDILKKESEGKRESSFYWTTNPQGMSDKDFLTNITGVKTNDLACSSFQYLQLKANYFFVMTSCLRISLNHYGIVFLIINKEKQTIELDKLIYESLSTQYDIFNTVDDFKKMIVIYDRSRKDLVFQKVVLTKLDNQEGELNQWSIRDVSDELIYGGKN